MFTKYDAERFAEKKLKEFNLDKAGWTFDWDNARIRLGCCDFTNKKVTLAHSVFDAIKPDLKEVQAKDTILHELGHALAGRDAGHGHQWKAVTISIGGSAKRCYDDDVILDKAKLISKYTGMCPVCGRTTVYHRKGRYFGEKACGVCCKKHNGGKWDARFIIEITQNY